MGSIKLVCPNQRALIGRFEQRTLCVRVNTPQEIIAAANDVRAHNNLFCVICDSKIPIEEIDIGEDWENTPIALMAPSVGRFRNISKKLELLRKLNLRVYLPCNEKNLTGVRLLASVGIPTCIVFNVDHTLDWDALADLMTYALLGGAQHAPIEPFQTIANSYRQTSRRGEDWGRVYFEDSSRYLHIDVTGKIALSHRELLAGDFIADDLSKLDSLEIKEAIEDRMNMWRNLFLENHFCARCSAWRICRGKFSKGKTEPNGCVNFFDEMADIVEQYRNKLKSNRPVEKWQP